MQMRKKEKKSENIYIMFSFQDSFRRPVIVFFRKFVLNRSSKHYLIQKYASIYAYYISLLRLIYRMMCMSTLGEEGTILFDRIFSSIHLSIPCR